MKGINLRAIMTELAAHSLHYRKVVGLNPAGSNSDQLEKAFHLGINDQEPSTVICLYATAINWCNHQHFQLDVFLKIGLLKMSKLLKKISVKVIYRPLLQ